MVDSSTPYDSDIDDLEQRLVRLLQLDGRIPLSRAAHALDVSERTVARRYQRLRTLGLRVVGRPVPSRLGLTRWLLCLRCAPGTADATARALARRPDISWVTVDSGSTEIYGALSTRTAADRDALLLRKLPRTPHVVSASAHCMMRTFIGDTTTWHATRFGAAGPSPTEDPGSRRAPLPLDATDRTLFAELARDGRATLPELATATGRASSSVQRRLRRLCAEGALAFAVDFAPHLLGYHMNTHLWLRVAPAHLRTVGEALAMHPEIPFAAAVTGTANLVASGIFQNPYDLYEFLDRRVGPLPGILDVRTTAPLQEVKRIAPAHL
ncbi:Lrp/AsnC family transcriptional regulator [Streptomyces sp. NPDC004111]|uniref:Lrp/AsnC family transcriptional regulator n=1 Tax=Streptomyces sp. NPDC004111 TaxID=3364690 RepID=UPI0036B396DE